MVSSTQEGQLQCGGEQWLLSALSPQSLKHILVLPYSPASSPLPQLPCSPPFLWPRLDPFTSIRNKDTHIQAQASGQCP